MPRRKKKANHKGDNEEVSNSQPCGENDEASLGSARHLCLLKTSPQVGRFLVAKKNIKEGSVILTDNPLVVGPCQETKIVCIGCCVLLDVEDIASAHRCGGCGWPICGGGCCGLNDKREISVGGHSVSECNILKTYSNSLTPTSYNIITPLRCLLLKDENPEFWRHIIKMEAHDDIRRNIPSIWNKNKMTVVEPIRKLTDDRYAEELIHTICGVLEVNCFSVGADDIEARALYPTAYLLLHDCTPNTTHIDTDNFKMILRAAVDIPKQVAITVSYTSTLYNTQRRLKELKASKFFDCCCPRCSSSTELGTYMNGIKCPHCGDGWITPSQPLVPNSPWICSSCQQSVHYSLPVNLSERSSTDFETLKNNAIAADYEKILTKYEKMLHPHHSTLIRAKYALSQMYGKTHGHLIDEMSQEMLQRKYNICKDLLKVLDIVEPGMSRIRGVTLYESHAPLLLLTQFGAVTGRLTNKEVKQNLKKVRDLLTESVAILALEKTDTSEGQLYEVAKQALDQAKSWPL